jgi:O-acetyl-ADP-ribose deacetylase (regulator of RNase III)
MITYKKGNLLDTPDRIIAHGCNAQGVMGSGVALAVKKKYPWAFDQYYHEYCVNGLETGRNLYTSHNGEVYIVNMITQNYYGKDGKRYVSYDALDECMENLNRWMDEFYQIDVSMPAIGAGLGGGHWPIIREIIDHRLIDKNVTIWTL